MKLIQSAKRNWNKFLFLFPSALPRGMSEFEQFANSILDTYQIPNNDSTHGALTNMIMHTGITQSHLPKRYFVKSLLNAMAKEVAFAKQQQLRDARKLEAAKPQEAELAPVQDAPIQTT